ncbi:Thioesterase superfamily protein [Nonomuraea coxensis DSM 45129]|uniref:Thioesterase superfamily protein n=1 Tax=Nonomuraea coxensis DSM 45129 TaxID=1122611 RepID=A0ABX8TW77_9ACTN|nr:thioesterase family protein [Nonomuraea coxensis]QYC39521.1 Thioesterase superfamily protein [Nonomuraea coxensis DSM 45129]
MIEDGVHEPVQVHFDDLDAMGLLHNSRYALLVERAVGAYWQRLGWAPDPAGSAFKDVFLAVREFKVTYHVPIVGPGEPLVHFWMERMGRTSGVYGFRVLSADRTVVHAEGYRVNVNLDPATLRPAPFSDELRAAAGPLLRRTAAAC